MESQSFPREAVVPKLLVAAVLEAVIPQGAKDIDFRSMLKQVVCGLQYKHTFPLHTVSVWR